jgi:hypothetical protein
VIIMCFNYLQVLETIEWNYEPFAIYRHLLSATGKDRSS